jgi:hypothetical protein
MSDEVEWLEPEQLRSWMTLAALMIRLPGALDYQLQRDSGLTHFEYTVLAGLSESPGRSLRMSNLAGFANGSLSRLSPRSPKQGSPNWSRRRPGMWRPCGSTSSTRSVRSSSSSSR